MLLGVSHDCPKAPGEVAAAIRELRPTQVGLELCERRFKRIFPFGVAAHLDLEKTVRQAAEKRLRYGRDQLAAAVAAHSLGAAITLCDRDVQTTEARFLVGLSSDVLLAGSFAAYGMNRAAACAVWYAASRQLRRLALRPPGASEGQGRCGLEVAALPEPLLAELAAAAEALAADSALSPRERWSQLQRKIEAAAAEGGKDLGQQIGAAVEEALDSTAKQRIVEERDEFLFLKFQQIPGPLKIGIFGRAHLDGLEARWNRSQLASSAEETKSEVERLSSAHLPLWRAVAGRPLLWRLRGRLGRRFV